MSTPRVPPAPLDRILGTFSEDLRATFGQELVGVYLYGSAVSGGFDPALSDLDVVVVTAQPVDLLPFDEVAALVDRLAIREPDWADRLDIVFVARQTLAGFRSGGPFLEISHELPLRLIRRADDWLETWFLVRDADHALLGPPPSELIPPISTAEFLEEVAAGIPQFVAAVRDDSPDGMVAYRILTVCRLLCSLESGAVSTKADGAAWAIERFPEWAPLIRTAWEVRIGKGARAFTPAERESVPRLLAVLAAEVERRPRRGA